MMKINQPIEKISPLTPNELDKYHFGETEWLMNFSNFHHLFHINRLEEIITKIKFPILPHRKTVYDFIFLTEGNSIRSKGLHQYNFSKNTFFFLPAFQISTHEYLSDNARGYYCHFDSDIFNNLFMQKSFFEKFPFLHFLSKPTVEISEAMLLPILHIMERLENEYQSNKPLNANLVSAYLLALFTELNLVEVPNRENSKNSAQRITEKFNNLLSINIYKTNKVAEYASMLAVTPDYLNKCVKSTMGKTSQELLADMIILEAKVLLKQTNLSISEIAFKFSETNPSDFSRFFKNKTKLAPKDFRQMADFQ
ncbi:MAG: helix-turn-helix domain-containing protein [Bacteroidota bacterium]